MHASSGIISLARGRADISASPAPRLGGRWREHRFVDQLSATASPGVGQLAEKTLECRGIQRLAVSRIYDTEEEMFLFPPVSTSTTPESANSTTKSSSQNVGTNISAPT